MPNSEHSHFGTCHIGTSTILDQFGQIATSTLIRCSSRRLWLARSTRDREWTKLLGKHWRQYRTRIWTWQSWRCYNNGQYHEWVHERDRAGGTVWIGNTKAMTGLIWTCTEERWSTYWEKDFEDGATRKEETGKIGQDGDVKSVVATRDGRSRNKKREKLTRSNYV